ncbi:unnamed protein product [Closterium sp. NIES-53]
MALGQQASAGDMVVEGAEDNEEEGLEAATTMEAAEVAAMAMTTTRTDAVADGLMASVIFAIRADTCGAIATISLMDGLLLKAKRVEDQGEGEEEAVEAVAVAETQAPAAPEKDERFEEPAAVGKVTLHSLDYWVIDSSTIYSMTPPSRGEGIGKAMFKGADGKMVGLKNVLWVPSLAANLISAPLDEVVMDVVGPLKLGAAGAEYFLTIVDNDWKAENEAKIGMRFGEVKSFGLEHVELPLELSSGSTTTRQSSLVNGGEEAKDAEEEEEEVQQVSERAPTLPSRTTSAPWIRVTPQQRHESLHIPAAKEEGMGTRRIQAPNRLTYDALGKQSAKSALTGAAIMVGDDEESEYEECAFVFFSPVEMPGEPATLKEALGSSDAKWKKAMESELKSIEESGTWELVELPEGRKAITSKWLFKITSDVDGKIERYKSRLVAKGYQQKEKVDYKDLFPPVVKPTTLRTLLAGATIKGWVVKQMDVTTVFLNFILEEEILLAQPGGFDDGSGRV